MSWVKKKSLLRVRMQRMYLQVSTIQYGNHNVLTSVKGSFQFVSASPAEPSSFAMSFHILKFTCRLSFRPYMNIAL